MIGRIKFTLVAVISLASFAASAVADNQLAWSDVQGFYFESQCQSFAGKSVTDSALGDLTEKVIEVLGTTAKGVIAPFVVEHSFWQLLQNEKGEQIYLRCGAGSQQKDFFLFEVHVAESLDVVATV
ncbi:MAG: hypothetical protein KDD22_03025, partial [Bdellovibrionales bacterium]|nr:hypothetical protein [Bdellovibrionales bacterium]